jgi:hypothetical protein
MHLQQHRAITDLTNEKKKECLQARKKKETQGSEKNTLINSSIQRFHPVHPQQTMPAEENKNHYFPT